MTWLIVACSAYLYFAAFCLGRTINEHDGWKDYLTGFTVTLFWLPIILVMCAVALIDELPDKQTYIKWKSKLISLPKRLRTTTRKQ